MTLPMAKHADDGYAEVRPKKHGIMQLKHPLLSFADKHVSHTGHPSFESPPQAEEHPYRYTSPPKSPPTRIDGGFPYPSRTSIAPLPYEHPMKSRGLMLHANAMQKEFDDMQEKFDNFMSHAQKKDFEHKSRIHSISRENEELQKKASVLELEAENLKTVKGKPRAKEDIVVDIKGLLKENEKLHELNKDWGDKYHDLESLYQKKLDEESQKSKKMETKVKKLAIDNMELKHRFSEFGKGRLDPSEMKALSKTKLDKYDSDDELIDTDDDDDDDDEDAVELDKIPSNVRVLLSDRKERRSMYKKLLEPGGKDLALLKKKVPALLKKKKALIKKQPLDSDAPDIRALMDHISILHRKLDRYREDSRVVEKENKSLKEDLENVVKRHQMLSHASELGGRGSNLESLLPYDFSTSGNLNLVDRLFD